MDVLVIGSGGREHAICWKLVSDGHRVNAWPGNPGISKIAKCHTSGSVSDLDGIVAFAEESKTDLVVVGPEAPLVDGLADRLREKSIAVFGPGADGAELEGSKGFSKRFFRDARIKTADFEICENLASVRAAIERLGGRVVVKADGLAAGKGVVVCSKKEEALAAAEAMMRGRFGDAGKRLVIEERLEGQELSVMAVTDGKKFIVLAQAEDHKALLDGDFGPNTGGMGTVSPPTWASTALLSQIETDIFQKTLDELDRRGVSYRGVLYAGVMVDSDGVPWLLEYNCRFGDPETQPVLSRLNSDLGGLLAAAAAGDLGTTTVEWSEMPSVCVVMASVGYPEKPEVGKEIGGLDEVAEIPFVQVFHAGTRIDGDKVVTSGGRVLGVTASGKTVEEARRLAYDSVRRISFEGVQFRGDIGARGGRQ